MTGLSLDVPPRLLCAVRRARRIGGTRGTLSFPNMKKRQRGDAFREEMDNIIICDVIFDKKQSSALRAAIFADRAENAEALDWLHELRALFPVCIEEDVVRNDAWFLLHFMLSKGGVYVKQDEQTCKRVVDMCLKHDSVQCFAVVMWHQRCRYAWMLHQEWDRVASSRSCLRYVLDTGLHWAWGERCMARTREIEPELIAATWHPRRFVMWTLDTDKQRELLELFPGSFV